MRNETIEIKVGGMICRACTDAVQDALYGTRGVIKAGVSYYRGLATVEYDPDIVSPQQLKESIEHSGYPVDRGGIGGAVVDIICLGLIALLTWLLLRSGASRVSELLGQGVSLGYVFLIGLMTSAHCLGMCGGIILSQTTDASALAGSVQEKRKSRVLAASGFYNLGRVLSYTALGGAFGALGTVISYTPKTKSLVFVMAGLAVAVMGIQMLGVLPGLRRLSPQQNGLCALPLKARQAFVGKPLIVGLLTGLMPCAALYAMWVYAMGSGGFFPGAAIMLVFALGTAPLLLAFGALNSFVPVEYTKYMLKLSGVLVSAIGLKMLIKGLMLAGLL